MKRFLFVLLAMCVLLCACKKDTDETTDDTTTAEPMQTAEPTTFVTTDRATEPIVTEVTLDVGSDVDVKYEVLTLGDEELNAILEARSADILASYIPDISSIKELGGTAEYDVKLKSIYKSDKLISAVFAGTYAIYYENSEEGGDVLYTVNIDPVTGKIFDTSDLVNYDKLVDAFEDGRFGDKPDFSQYNSAYGIYPYVSVETVDGEPCICVYITNSGMYQEVVGYYTTPDAVNDLLKIKITAEG